MNDVFELYWKHFRTQLLLWWDALDENEVQWVNGKRENLIALVQAKYGYGQVECENIVRQQIDAFEQRHRHQLDSFIQVRRQVFIGLEPKYPAALPETLEYYDERKQMTSKAPMHSH